MVGAEDFEAVFRVVRSVRLGMQEMQWAQVRMTGTQPGLEQRTHSWW